jgi:hypothetical protein
LVTATNDISSGTIKYETDGAITATNKITGTTSNVTYDAKKSVTMSPGFEAKPTGTAVFKAYIDGCGNN